MIGLGLSLWRSGGSTFTYQPVYYHATGSGGIVAAGLHSSAATADGIANGTGYTSQTFSVDGMDPGASLSGIRFAHSSGEQTLLTSGARVTCYISKAALIDTTTPASTKYLLSTNAGYLTKQTNGLVKNAWPVDAASAWPIAITNTGKSAKIRIEMMHDTTYSWLIIDGLPQGRNITTALPTAANWANGTIGGLTSATGYWVAGNTVENYTLNTTPFIYTAHPDISSVSFFGDSFTTQGAPISTLWAASGAYTPWNPGYGFDNVGTPRTTGSWSGDAGYVCSAIRQLIAGGFCPVNTPGTHNQGQDGASFAGILTRVNALGSVPKLCFVGGGTNDIAGLRTGAAVRADLRAIVDALIAKGATNIIMWVPPSLRADVAYQSSTYDDAQTAINAEIAAMPAYSNRVRVVDLFSYFGGFSPDLTKFQSGNIHPNADGSTLIGQLMGQAAVASLTGA